MMKIKKHNNKNEYLLTASGWVRNFAGHVKPVDINRLYDKSDVRTMVSNETANRVLHVPGIDAEQVRSRDVVVVSDGYDFDSCQDLLKELATKKNLIIATHGALSKWAKGVRYNYYVVNNPGRESMGYVPKHGYLPMCVCSNRTYPDFVRAYLARGGVVFRYAPVDCREFTSNLYRPLYYVDDYRNAICAALSLAYRWQATNLLLLAPHDLFADFRPAAEKLSNGMYIYPQQVKAHGFIDGCLYWLNAAGCRVGYVSSGPDFSTAERLTPEKAMEFLNV